MTINVGDWVGEQTATEGTGNLVLLGPLQGYAGFSTVGDGEYWYTIVNGLNKESGNCTIVGNQLVRTNVSATLINTQFTGGTGASVSPLSLSGISQVYITFNRDTYESLYAVGLLPLNNVWTGSNTFNNTLLSPGAGANSLKAGDLAGSISQGIEAIALGYSAGNTTQGDHAVSVGSYAAEDTQGSGSVAIGYKAGQTEQGYIEPSVTPQNVSVDPTENGIAIGAFAAQTRQKPQSIAIGSYAGYNAQGARGIIISSTGAQLNDTTTGHIHITSSAASIDYDTSNKKWTVTEDIGGTNTTYDFRPVDLLPLANSWTGLNIFNAGLESKGVGSGSFRAGYLAGETSQGSGATAVGREAGKTSQDARATAIGYYAGEIQQSVDCVAVGLQAGNDNQEASAVAIGKEAGRITQGASSVAVGSEAGKTNQGESSVAVGFQAGFNGQAPSSVAVGQQAGQNNQSSVAIAVGLSAGETSQGTQAIAIGSYAGQTSQSFTAIAIGYLAGQTLQKEYATAVGLMAGQANQAEGATAIGHLAGTTGQIQNATAVGKEAGKTTQGDSAVAVGFQSGFINQKTCAVAVGCTSGRTTQGENAVAVGVNAGNNIQGDASVAIGQNSGRNSQGANSVAIGTNAANTGQLAASIAIGASAGQTDQQSLAVAVGLNAGQTDQGSRSVAIGTGAGSNQQGTRGIIINADTPTLDDTTSGHIHIRSSAGSIDYTSANGWSATDGAETFALRVDGWLAQFPAGRPIFIVGTGQSNSTGRGPNVSVTTNTNIKDWASDGSGGAQTWRTPNTETATVKADYSNAADYIGYKEGQFGNIHISMANFIAQRSGRTVYVLQVGRDGAPSAYWNPATQPSGQATYTTLKNAMTAVLATTELTAWSIDKPDILNIMQGESDAGALLPISPTSPTLSGNTWADNWLSYMKNASTNWFAENHTRVFVYDVSETANWGPTSQASAPWRWNGVSALAEAGGNFFEYVSSVGIPVGVGAEEVHFSGIGSNLQGEIGAKIALSEISPATPVNNGWDIVDGTAPSGMPYTLKNQNRTAYQSNGTTVSRVAGNVEIDAAETKITTVAGTLNASIGIQTGDRNSTVTTDSLGNLARGNPVYNGLKIWSGTTVATASASDTIIIGTFSLSPTASGRFTGIVTLESLEFSPSGASTPAITVQYTLNIFPYSVFGINLVGGTMGLPFGHDPAQGSNAPQNPPVVSLVGGSQNFGLQIRVIGQAGSGTTKHRLTYVYNDISGI